MKFHGEENPGKELQGSEFEAIADLKAADALISKQKLLGWHTKFTAPLSAQLKAEWKALFEQDADFYKKVDTFQRDVILTYAVLRFVTYALFVLYILTSYNILFLKFSVETHASNIFAWLGQVTSGLASFILQLSGDSLWIAFAVTTGAFFLLRIIVRSIAFVRMNIKAEKLAHRVANQRWEVLLAGTHAINKAKEPPSSTSDWSQHAGRWTKVASWYAKRAEYVDRYSTTVNWLIQFYINRLENIFSAAKAGTVLALALHTFVLLPIPDFLGLQALPESSHVTLRILSGLLMICTVIFWYFLGSAKTSFFREAFEREFAERETQVTGGRTDYKQHFFDQMAGLASGLVKQVILVAQSHTADELDAN